MRYSKLIFIVVCASCGGGISNFTEELSGGFIYVNSGGSLNVIQPPSDRYSGIHGEVTSYAYNYNFIIAAQRPSKIGHQSKISFRLRRDRKRYPTNSQGEMLESDRIADSIITNDPYYQKIFSQKLNYWIISHKNKKMYGPLSEVEYLKSRKELKVPDELQLEDEYIP